MRIVVEQHVPLDRAADVLALMSRGFISGNWFTHDNVGFVEASTSERLIPHEMAFPPPARQSAGKNGLPLRTSHGVSRIANIGMLLSESACQMPT